MVNKRKKISNFLLAIIIVAFILSLIFFIYILYFQSKLILDKQEIIAKLKIGEPIAFDVNSTALVFGRLPIGSSSNRDIKFSNNYEFPIKAEFSVKGDIKDFLVFDKVVYLDVGEKKNVTISTVSIPEATEYGNYSGIMTIVFKRDISS